MINVRLVQNSPIKATLRPEKGIRVDDHTTYLYDPTLIDAAVAEAKDWAIKMDGKVVEDGEEVDYSSKYYASEAKTSETNAATSASSASTSANLASGYANSASADAGTATTKASEAAASASSAATSASNASTSATNASNSASIAVAAATDPNVVAVGTNIQNINKVADNETNINTVVGMNEDISTVANISNYVADVGAISADVSTVAGIASDVSAVNDIASEILAVEGISSDIQTVSGIASDVSNVVDMASDIQAVESISSDIQTVSNISSDVSTVSGISSNISSVVSMSSDISTVNSNAAAITNVSNNMSSVVYAVDYATEAKVWAEGTDSEVEDYGGDKSSKGWAKVAQDFVESIGAVLRYKGSVETRDDLPTSGQEIGDMYNILSDGSNCVWDGSDWDEISGIVDLSEYRKAADQDTIDAGKVPTSRTINNKALTEDITLTASDVGALPDSTVIPTVNNATLTIQKNGTTIDTFTANSSTNKTVNVTVPTQPSDIGAATSAQGAKADSALQPNSTITGATKCKITYDSNGLVTAGSDLEANDIPSLTISKISDITATASELNVLDGITASTTELNYLDGVTSSIQTQLNGKQPTGNYMTTDTEQSVGAGATKTFNGRVNFIGTGDANAIYLSTDTRIDVYGTNRTVLGFANGTFLINHSSYPLNLRGSGARPAWNGTSYLALTSDIGNATLTIQKNGTTVDTFNANATSDKTINITVPTNNNELTNGAGYQTSSDVASAISVETTNRENADIGLQQQIDAITASSDVKDIVGTYAQLQAYDTSTLGNNDIIKVLQDETHDNETTYYRWSTTTETFTLIGEEGPYYTKSESDSTFVPQTRTVNNKALSSNITLTASDVGALPDNTVIPTVNNATLTIQKNGTSVKTFTANASTDVTCNITVPTDTSDLTNGAGYITGISSSDVTTALGYTPYNSSNPNGYTSNIGTVTSVNNVSPVNGNVSLSIPVVDSALSTTSENAIQNKIVALALSGKQDTLTAGDGIDITNNTISMDKIFWVTYGTTPYNDIVAAWNAGKIVLMLYKPNSNDTILFHCQRFYWARFYFNSTVNSNLIYNVTLDWNNNWYLSSLTQQSTSNLVTSVSSSSTDSQYPSAKCVYDIIGNIETLLSQV